MNAKKSRDVEAGMPSREDILKFIAEHPGKVGKREIARAFDVKGGGRIALKRILREMADEGLLERRGKQVSRPGALAPVEVLEVTGRDRDGELLAAPTDWDEAAHGEPPVVLIVPERARKGRARPAGVGDRVLVRITEAAGDGVTHEGRVIRVLENRPSRIVGVFIPSPEGGGVVQSVDKKNRQEFRVAPGDEGGAREDALVSVELSRGSRFKAATAKVRDVVGDMKSEKAVSQIALITHGIPQAFSQAALDEADRAPHAGISGRTDLRALPLVTIDPADAKDHDDAVHAAADADPENPGGWIVTVAIADVAEYVRPGSALDRGALERGNSVYFPDRVVPMLPERLSTDLCSLRAGEDRPAMVAEMVIGADGRKRKHRFLRATVRVAAGLDYTQAQSGFDGMPVETAAPVADSVLGPLWAAYRALAKARDEREPLDLDIPERKLVLDGDGHVQRVIVPERLESHRLIESFMILANVAAAETLEAHRTPLLYRVHDAPSPEKLAALGDFLSTIGMKMPKSGVLTPSHFNSILRRAREGEHDRIVNEVVLRSQSQAEYSAENFGHFGLNLRRYAHFTSPIRRYSDLIVHRGLIRALGFGKDGLQDREIDTLDETAAHVSATERRAMAAERETVDRLIAHFLADRVGAVFPGRVSGVTRSGLFVKLDDTGADGFVPAATIGADYYRFDEAGQQMVGDRTGETYRLGDAVEVKLVEAIPIAGALRFEIVSEGRYLSSRPRTRRVQKAASRRPKVCRKGSR